MSSEEGAQRLGARVGAPASNVRLPPLAPMACMEPVSSKTAHSRKKVMMTFSTQNGEIFQSATVPDRVSIEDEGGKCHTSETGGASGGST